MHESETGPCGFLPAKYCEIQISSVCKTTSQSALKCQCVLPSSESPWDLPSGTLSIAAQSRTSGWDRKSCPLLMETLIERQEQLRASPNPWSIDSSEEAMHESRSRSRVRSSKFHLAPQLAQVGPRASQKRMDHESPSTVHTRLSA